MKTLIETGVVFTPGSRTLDFSAVPNFAIHRLYGVINATAGTKLYAPGITGFGYSSAQNNVLTLQADTSQMSAQDELIIVWEDPSVLAKDQSIQDLLAAVRAQRSESIWTDDTGARFIRRMGPSGTPTWTDVAGNASSPPGTGARPDSDSGTVVSRYTYVATAGGTGYASGDLLDHVVVTDGDAGDLVSNFWLNITSGAKIAAPTSGTFSPVDQGSDPASPVVANQGTGTRGWLATIAGLLKRGATNIAGALSFAPATDVSNLEPAGAKITAAAMPAGGTGLTGWLSAIWYGITGRSTWFLDGAANTAVAANATALDTTRDLGAAPSQWARFNALVSSTTDGKAFIQFSDNGTNQFLYSTPPVSITANTPVLLTAPPLARYARVVFVNGATAGAFSVRGGLAV